MNSKAGRLLIVDDNEMNRDMLARRLARKGYEVVLADNARQLLERIKKRGRLPSPRHRNAGDQRP